MSATLLLRCAGPMQSWGTRSRFGERDTEREPSKSGICGLLAAAEGRPRNAPLDDLAALRVCVRIDDPGHVESDYQTAGGGNWKGQRYGVATSSGSIGETSLSRRYYLADADFLVALEGPRPLLERLSSALANPRWPLFLGRRGHAPGLPPHIPGGLLDLDAETALRSFAWPMDFFSPRLSCPALVECQAGEPGDLRRDVPLSFAPLDRRYGERRVRRITLTPLPPVVES